MIMITNLNLCERSQSCNAFFHGNSESGVDASCQGDVDEGQEIRQNDREHSVHIENIDVGQGVHENSQQFKHQVINCLKRTYMLSFVKAPTLTKQMRMLTKLGLRSMSLFSNTRIETILPET